MSKSVKFTVIIPTRERAETLGPCLRTALAQDYGNLEIIVSDNCSWDGTRDLVRGFKDKRVKYINTGRRVSMTQNFEFALSQVKKGWVSILGDDDGLLPAALEKAAGLIKATGVKALKSDVCLYAWPSLTGEKFGRLCVSLKPGRRLRSSKAWLAKIMSGRASYSELPMLYTGGFISLELINKVRRGGAFFRSRIPDVYSALAVSSVVDKYLYSYEPLAVTGLSKYSTGISLLGFGKKWVSTVFAGRAAPVKSGGAPAREFLSEANLPFHPALPLCADGHPPRSLQALVYESYLQSAHLRGGVGKTSHRRQLEVILRTAGAAGKTIREWGKAFAAAHKLDYAGALAAAKKAERAGRRPPGDKTCFLGSPDLPLKDVYAASLAGAGAIGKN